MTYKRCSKLVLVLSFFVLSEDLPHVIFNYFQCRCERGVAGGVIFVKGYNLLLSGAFWNVCFCKLCYINLQKCLCVRVRAYERIFVPICIWTLDPGLYTNVKHFRFILGFTTLFHLSHSFSMWGQFDPKIIKLFKKNCTPSELPNQVVD